MLVRFVGDWDPDAAQEVKAAAPDWVTFVDNRSVGVLLMQGKRKNLPQVGTALRENQGGVLIVVGSFTIDPRLINEFFTKGAHRVTARLGGPEGPEDITRLFATIRRRDVGDFFGVEIVET